MTLQFPYDRVRAEQAVLWLLHKHGGAISILKLVKLVFLADREHLARYGRPIVGGHYVARPLGPVPSELYDALNGAETALGLFVRREDAVVAQAPSDEDVLSESDIEVLSGINQRYGSWDAFRLTDLTHQLQAWKRNYRQGASQRSFALPYEDFFADLDEHARGILPIVEEDREARAALE